METNQLVELLKLSINLMFKARLLTSYSGNGERFVIEEYFRWYCEPQKYHSHVQYPLRLNSVNVLLHPRNNNKYMNLFKRIEIKKINDWKESISDDLNRFNIYSNQQLKIFNDAHHEIVLLLKGVLVFINSENIDFEENKKDIILDIENFKIRFSNNPILHGSYCEVILENIEKIIIESQAKTYINEKINIQIKLIIAIFEKTEKQLRKNLRKDVGEDIILEFISEIKNNTKYEIFGISKNLVLDLVKDFKEKLSSQINNEKDMFIKFFTILMVCYSEAIDLTFKTINYIIGNEESINFDNLMEKENSNLQSENKIVNGFIEGDIYRELNFDLSFKKILEEHDIILLE